MGEMFFFFFFCFTCFYAIHIFIYCSDRGGAKRVQRGSRYLLRDGNHRGG